jgi:hypothetical protein
LPFVGDGFQKEDHSLSRRNLHGSWSDAYTLDRSDDLIAEAKAFAARERLTLTRLIEEGLALRLRQRRVASPPVACPPLPVHHGQGGLAVVVTDPRGNRSLFDAAGGLGAT